MPDGYYAAPYTGVGFCATLGKGGAAVVAGLLVGAATGGLFYAYEKSLSKEDRIKGAIVLGLIFGGTAAGLAYFFCKGVEVGAPVRVMR